MKFWTPDEVATLRRMRADGCTLDEIAEAVGRTKCACRAKTASLGLQTKAKWCREDLETLRRLTEQGLTDEEVASELDRSLYAVQKARSRNGVRARGSGRALHLKRVLWSVIDTLEDGDLEGALELAREQVGP